MLSTCSNVRQRNFYVLFSHSLYSCTWPIFSVVNYSLFMFNARKEKKITENHLRICLAFINIPLYTSNHLRKKMSHCRITLISMFSLLLRHSPRGLCVFWNVHWHTRTERMLSARTQRVENHVLLFDHNLLRSSLLDFFLRICFFLLLEFCVNLLMEMLHFLLLMIFSIFVLNF